ncbi:hypothetical protein NSU_2314 [Novosphingobium pentaromativorans US6-1]|uniref:Uncharacterized protein n=1 Tax=Novosphingobium pentaromativorans US6-1 TaxID=1088721 RepID=G6ED93_9SPHN|nr:hypothetical protein NSU_2314 [Novosphingobium pentaromativorans US6-1]
MQNPFPSPHSTKQGGHRRRKIIEYGAAATAWHIQLGQ